jgi:hypothetical protein
MHDIEPFFKWRDEYTAETDARSPFYGQTYSEFEYSNKIYNYFIHPQWDEFGSHTLYGKLLFVDYDEGFAMLEFIGEWNDCLHNDVMMLKDEVINQLVKNGISKFILFCDNVLNFHGSDDCYYEEWWDDIKDEDGWIAMINTFDHVVQELKRTRLQHYVNFGEKYNFQWRNMKPEFAYQKIQDIYMGRVKELW